MPLFYMQNRQNMATYQFVSAAKAAKQHMFFATSDCKTTSLMLR